MKSRNRRRRVAAGAFSALVLTLGLAACGSFDSAASGEHLIKDYIKERGRSQVSLKSVKCPSGVRQKVNTAYNCQVVLHVSSDNTDHSGTITVHIASGNKVLIRGAQDVHVR